MNCQLKLRISAGARRNALMGWRGDALKISITAAPEKGKANKAVIKLLAAQLDIPAASISIKRGQTSPDKTIEILGLSPTEAQQRLQKLIGAPPPA